MARDLMVETIEARFDNISKLVKKIHWLTDNGPAYVANGTVAFARILNLEPCTTPSYSPKSNGMAEALVQTFKRNYARISDLSCAEVVMKELPYWFEDYNEVAAYRRS